MKSLKTLTLTLLLLLAAATQANAQKLNFGYIDYDKLLKAQPDYAAAQQRVKLLHEQYQKEAQYNEDKFYRMYAEYLQGQKSFPEEIMLKRQKELQVAMEQGVSFRKDAEKLLQQAEAELVKPIEDKLNKAIATVSQSRNLSFVINTSRNACPYINPADGTDITELVQLVYDGKPLPPVETPEEMLPTANTQQ